ncbi:hypothetical protein Tco_0208572 [Tanacetum coccineum]
MTLNTECYSSTQDLQPLGRSKFSSGNCSCMFTRSIVIQKRVDDVQLRVESYQKKLNITKSQTKCEGISRLLRADELYKFCDGTLKDVRDNLHDILQNFVLGYNKAMPTRKWSEKDQEWTAEMLKLIDDLLLERQIMRIFECYVGSRLNETDYECRRSEFVSLCPAKIEVQFYTLSCEYVYM